MTQPNQAMHQLSPIIKGLIPGLTERGKIKIGRKGAMREKQGGGMYQLPEKLDHFVVTTLERGKDNNFLPDKRIHDVLGPEPKEIPVRLLYNSIAGNFQCRYACYFGRKLYCSGDGEYAHQLVAIDKPERKEISCPCHRCDPTFKGDDGRGNGKCKVGGTLSVLIDGAGEVGGVWKFRTTGWNSTNGILSSLALLRGVTAGIVAGIPLSLVIQAKASTNPTDNSAVTVHVVCLIYKGSIADLQSKTLAIAQGNAEFRARLGHVEEEAHRLISVDAGLVDEAADIVEEYYPEEPETPTLPAPEIPAPPTTPTLPASEIPAPPTKPVATAEPQAKQRRGRSRKTAQATPEPASATTTTDDRPPASSVQADASAVPPEPAPEPAVGAVPSLALPDGMQDLTLF